MTFKTLPYDRELEEVLLGSGCVDRMVYVEGGTFLMDKEREIELKKFTRQIELKPYLIGLFPVTQGLWKLVSKRKGYSESGNLFPVDWVSSTYAIEFLKELNFLTGLDYRLPTVAEWEFAARGGVKSLDYKYAGSDYLQEVGWFKGNSYEQTKPVGLKRPNELGLYDMSGNVWEWCRDISINQYGVVYDGSSIDKENVCKSNYYMDALVLKMEFFTGLRLAHSI